MIVKSIELLNFRNYRELSLLLDERTNIFYGDNAQGKTNILEAVYLSGTTRSHRGSRDRDLIRFGEEEAHIRTQIRRRDLEYQIDIHLKKNKSKGIAVNGVPIRRASELFASRTLYSFLRRIWGSSSRDRRSAGAFLTWSSVSSTGCIFMSSPAITGFWPRETSF